MNVLEKWYSLLIFVSVVIGIGLGRYEVVKINAEFFIVPFLVIMLYLTFLQIPLGKIKQAFKNVTFTLTTIMMNFVWTPILAWLLASVFLSEHPALWIGFIMLMVTPCTDWYLVFTGIAKGNTALSASILPVNLLLQILLLPVYLLLFTGTTGIVEMTVLVESVFIVLFIPLVLSILTKTLFKNKERIKEKVAAIMSGLPIVFLNLAIVAMFAMHGQLLLDNIDLVWIITVPIALFFITNFIIAQRIGSFLRFSYEDRASFSLTTLARNSPIALAIAMTAFPDEPLVALTLVVGPLLELPILVGITQLLLFFRGREAAFRD
ncbi:arsenic resistance protein [Halalkalibacterium ligniniphilum]|uniref:arsenic resistance protein n=1 Tax=Halalkalibacterium ligniniphilum TaxID=1134413 RepID=UPI00034578A6|nr:bile acid:sodium symporter [Halalkalibacterium ligniniphilum]